MAKKKLVVVATGQPAHRNCRAGADRSPAPARTTRAPQDISRAELLRRIEALRKRDPKMKASGAKVQPTKRSKPRPKPRDTQPTVVPPRPYYGVAMKVINGQWVQLDPHTE
ncbi:hypothetical protein [Streptomyces sp. NBC_00356]|uniref:hypothetical protein n=1 Tax=Streptomyces sp. NBC_00356 TaxID=2975724 RepID=UPI002E25DE94